MINRAIGTAVSTTAAALLVMAVAPRMAIAGPAEVIITVGSADGAPGDFVFVDVTLSTGGLEVAGVQNDIGFQPQAAIAANESGRPFCEVNPDIMKEATTFAFQPAGCEVGGGAGPVEPCTGIRALVLSLGNVDAIPDGSVLYTCEIAIAGDAPGGEFVLANTGAGSSTPDGMALPTIGDDGVITVFAEADATIAIGSATGSPGDFVFFDVVLDPVIPAGAGIVEVAGTQNDITFQPQAAIAADENGRPFCAVNPDIMKEATTFAFQPPGCTVGGGAGVAECTAIRALVLSLGNVDPIPPGSVLYSCEVAISSDAPDGSFPLVCSNAQSSDPNGMAVSTDCTDGAVIVSGVTPTPVPTATSTPAPDTPTPMPPPPSTGDNDSCQVVAPADSEVAWLLLLPVAALFWMRRRSRLH